MATHFRRKMLLHHVLRRTCIVTAAVAIGLHVLGTLLWAVEPAGTTTATDLTWHPTPVPRQISFASDTHRLRNGKLPTISPPTQLNDANRIQRLEDQLEDLQRRLTAAEQRSAGPVLIHAGHIQPEAECFDCFPEYPSSTSEQIFGSQYPTLKWSGFLQLDTGWVYQDGANAETIGDVDSQTGLRRVRLRVAGDIRRDSSYVVDLDFAASGHPSFRDVMLIMHEIPVLQNVRFGYFQQPFGMDAMTSGRELLFQERPLPFAFSPFRQTGIAAYGTFANKRATWSTSTYWFPTDEFGVFDSGSGGHSVAGRLTLLPIDYGDGHLIHVGFDYATGDPGDNTIRYAIEPGFFVTDPTTNQRNASVPTIVDTGNIPTHFYNLFNAEIGLGRGPFHLQSEARFAVVNQVGGPSLIFPGYYVNAGYILTGETRPYDREHGTFHKTVPKRDFELGRGGGAYELVAGWAYIDLNDHNIEGGRASTLSGGLNWYLNKHVKYSFNVISSTLDDAQRGRSHAWIASARVQAEF
jgi:phosphate-selective porin OprO/OprP